MEWSLELLNVIATTWYLGTKPVNIESLISEEIYSNRLMLSVSRGRGEEMSLHRMADTWLFGWKLILCDQERATGPNGVLIKAENSQFDPFCWLNREKEKDEKKLLFNNIYVS